MRAVAHAVEAAWEAERDVPDGAFEVKTGDDGQRWFWFKCPGPCKAIASLCLRPVLPKYADGRESSTWELSGTPEAPTLMPSINHLGCWHGWLRDGVFAAA